jgi:hypothetical protein
MEMEMGMMNNGECEAVDLPRYVSDAIEEWRLSMRRLES